MKWGPDFWTGLLGAGLLAYGAINQTRVERGEALAKRLILAAAGNDRRLFINLLASVIPDVDHDALGPTWDWARRAASQVEDYKLGRRSDFKQFSSFKEWCVSLY